MTPIAATAPQTASPPVSAGAPASIYGLFTKLVQEFAGEAAPVAPPVAAKSDTPTRLRVPVDERYTPRPDTAPQAPAKTGDQPATLPVVATVAAEPAALPEKKVAEVVPAMVVPAAAPDSTPAAPPAAPTETPVAATAKPAPAGTPAKRSNERGAVAEQQPALAAMAFPVALPFVPPLPLPERMAPVEKGPRDKAPVDVAAPAADPAPQEHAVHTDVALQLRLRRQDGVAPLPALPERHDVQEAKPAVQQQVPAKTKEPEPAVEQPAPDKNVPRTVIARQAPVEAAAIIPAAPVVSNERASAPTASAAPLPPVRPAAEPPAPLATAHLQEPVMDQKTSQPTLRSVALEFTPDGAGDVRLRVSERAGEVHISLHSQDSALSGRLHEGVQELVGSLSRAGYEAEAWTSGQDRQNQQQQQQHPGGQHQGEDKRRREGSPDAAVKEDFSSIFIPQGQEK